MLQRWSDLLFAHWSWDPEVIQATLPKGLRVDTWDERAWLGVVPFAMSGIRPRGLPSLPWLSAFLELNVRTYVYEEATGLPGVWFYSLDAARWPAVQVARHAFHLPYHHASMSLNVSKEGWIAYESRRFSDRQAWAQFRYRVRETAEEAQQAETGSFEWFLVERYLLFSYDARRDRLYSGCVRHRPYRLRLAEAELDAGGLVRATGLKAPAGAPDHLCFAEPVDVNVFSLEALGVEAGV